MPFEEMFAGSRVNKNTFYFAQTLINDNMILFSAVTAYCEMDSVSRAQGAKLMPLSQSDKWLFSARILDTVKVTTTDTGLIFFKFRKRAISYEEYLRYLKDLAEYKNLDFKTMKYKMERSGKPMQ